MRLHCAVAVALLVAPCGVEGQDIKATPPSSTVAYYPNISARLGGSFSPSGSAPAKRSCLKSSKRIDIGSNFNTTLSLVVTRDVRAVFQHANYNVSASASDLTGQIAKVNGSLNAVYTSNDKSDAIYVLIVGARDYGGTQVEEAALQAGLPVNERDFKDQCGSGYISTIFRTATIYSLLTFDKSDYELYAALNGSIGGTANVAIFSASSSTTVSAVLNHKITRSKLRLVVESTGIKKLTPIDVPLNDDVIGTDFSQIRAALDNLSGDDVETVSGFAISPYPDRLYNIVFVDHELIPARRHYELAVALQNRIDTALEGRDRELAVLSRIPANRLILDSTSKHLAVFITRARKFITCYSQQNTTCGERPRFVADDYALPRYKNVQVSFSVEANGAPLGWPRLADVLGADYFASDLQQRAGGKGGAKVRVTVSVDSSSAGTNVRFRTVELVYYEQQLYTNRFSTPVGATTLVVESTDAAENAASGGAIPKIAFEMTDRAWRGKPGRPETRSRPGPGGINGKNVLVCVQNDEGVVWRMSIGGVGWGTLNYDLPNEKMLIKGHYTTGGVAEVSPSGGCNEGSGQLNSQ
jgi:hypothetical protein